MSNVTAAECTQLLDITPQVVTPNGFEADFVPAEPRYRKERQLARSRMLDIARALTGKQLPEDTLLVATSGRNEYRNKGIDLFIDSLNSLRHSAELGKPVVAFILVPAWADAPRQGLLRRLEGEFDAPLDSNSSTHSLHNEDSDAIMCRLRQLGVNQPSDKVDFVYLPCYLNGGDGVLDIPYYKVLPALDLTIFPSYYEPWGYTPLESIAFGVPTVSSDKAGFGQWIMDDFEATFSSCGAEVVERTDSNYWGAADSIARRVEFMSQQGADDMKEIRKAAAHTATFARWQLFIKHYLDAFEVARRRDERIK